jgi:hypothetical protein
MLGLIALVQTTKTAWLQVPDSQDFCHMSGKDITGASFGFGSSLSYMIRNTTVMT